MGPSRRKGASKAAAAAAARRQWKVGDLVLAKVKGFPAWPATVSEPEKWGYSVDWKKVLVFFFGTQQIAFCNPADVEPFTEAKKQSLLTKRHAKGSDFVRAVQEIIDSYEKLKSQNQADEVKLEEAAKVNESKDKPEAPEATFEPQDNPSNLTVAGNGPSAVEDTTSDTALVEKKEVPSDNTPVDTEPPLLTSYSSRKRTRDLPLQGELKESLVRKSRSSSRLRDKSKMKTVEVSEHDGAALLAFASSGYSVEENGSEVVTVESDTLSLNEGSTIDYDSQVNHNSQAVGSAIELGKTLDLPVKAVLKGKRKPSRKRSTNDTAERIATIDKEPGSIENDYDKMGMSESIKNDLEKMGLAGSSKNDFEVTGVDERLKNDLENKGMAGSIKNDLEKMGVVGSCPKENGDEHLPLVKRARVRMSELPSLMERTNTVENAQKEISVHNPREINKPSYTEKSSDRGLFSKNSALDVSTQFQGSMSNHWKAKKDHSFSCSVHGESALPPSKRLHRALEAMCANNAAEEGQLLNAKSSEGQMAIARDVDSIASDAQAAEKTTESSPEADIVDNRAECSDTQKNESGKELSPKLCSLERKECGNSQGSDCDLLLPPQKGNAERIECNNDWSEGAEKESDVCRDTEMSVDPVLATHEDVIDASPPVSSAVELQFNHVDDASFEKSRSSDPPLDDSREENEMSEVVTEVVNKHTQKEGNNHVGDGIGNHSSPSVTDGGNSLPLASPHNASSGHVSTSDNGSFIQNNGSCSPDVQLHRKISSDTLFDEEGKSESMVSQRPKSAAGKYTELNAALSSFEAMLESLTRTKESIGRATRVALECAKLGLSSKVVDILAHCLELETALNRRVDFFFLVDSILKADVSGLYPSAIQAMLPRLLAAAAPPGNSAHENRRQCLKVLRLWLERKILSESVIRRHMRELDHNSSAVGAYSRRSSRTERSFDDPIREMEGMLVDEYGSNSSFQLPGFCIPSMIKDEEGGSDSDEGSFEAVTPEHSPEDNEISSAMEKHRHILEDVDGELEMEDVAPPCEEQHFERNSSDPFAPPLPHGGPPSSPPLPASPPPLPPPVLPPGAVSEPYANGLDSKRYADTHDSSNCHRPSTPRMNRTMSEASHYHSSDQRDIQRQIPESFPGPHFHNKNYPLRPPPPPPNNQYSYGREPHYKQRREAGPPPPYSNRHHYEQHWDRENYYNNHERMKHGPYEPHDGWRVPPHSFSGPPYHGKGKYYGPDPGGPPCEDGRYPHQEWRFPHRSMNHRNSVPFRPPLDGPIPVSNRGPGYWPPR